MALPELTVDGGPYLRALVKLEDAECDGHGSLGPCRDPPSHGGIRHS